MENTKKPALLANGGGLQVIIKKMPEQAAFDSPCAVRYVFYAKKADCSLREAKEKEGAAFAVNLPPQYSKLAKCINVPESGLAEFGYVSYWEAAPLALTKDYFPYGKLRSGVFRLADFLEFFVLRDLEKGGAKKISSAACPQPKRAAQLSRRGVKYQADVCVSDMKKRVSLQIRKFAHSLPEYHLLIKKRLDEDAGFQTQHTIKYAFCLKRADCSIRRAKQKEGVVFALKIPKIFQPLTQKVEIPDSGEAEFGYMSYETVGSLGVVRNYNPYVALSSGQFRLADFLDYFVLSDLEKNGVARVTDSSPQTEKRKWQHWRRGIESGKPVFPSEVKSAIARQLKLASHEFEKHLLPE